MADQETKPESFFYNGVVYHDKDEFIKTVQAYEQSELSYHSFFSMMNQLESDLCFNLFAIKQSLLSPYHPTNLEFREMLREAFDSIIKKIQKKHRGKND